MYFLIIIILSVFITFKILSMILKFNTTDMNIKLEKKSVAISILVVLVCFAISIGYNTFLQDNLVKLTSLEVILSGALVDLLQLFLVIFVVVIRREGFLSIGITKRNILKSIISGTICGIIWLVLDIKFSNKVSIINFMSVKFLVSIVIAFINMLVVGFVEEVLFRGYLQTRLIYAFGTLKGYFITTLIFTLSHLPKYLIGSRYSINYILNFRT